MEETVAIETSEEALSTYLNLAAARIACGGGDLYVGRFLRRFEGRTVTFSPPVAAAVAIFELNLSAWGDPAAHCRGPASPGAANERSAHRGNYLAPTPSSYHQAGLSTSTVSRICQVLGSQSELWKHRDLGPSIPTVDQVPPAIRRDAGAPAVT